GGGGVFGRGPFGRVLAGLFFQVAGLAGGGEPVRAGGADVVLGVVAGVLDDGTDAAGHRGVAGGDIVAGAVLVLAGAQAVVAFAQHGRVAGVGGVGGGDDGGALDGDLVDFLCLQHVAGVLAGVAAEHQPVVGGGVLAVVALDEAAAADREQPRVRVSEVARRLGLLPVLLAGGGLRLGCGL